MLEIVTEIRIEKAQILLLFENLSKSHRWIFNHHTVIGTRYYHHLIIKDLAFATFQNGEIDHIGIKIGENWQTFRRP